MSPRWWRVLAGVQLVWRTLTDDHHREEYDKRNAQGRAPKVGDLRGASAAPSPTSSGPAAPPPGPRLAPAHEKARKLMDQGKHKEALSALKEELRVDNPSDPDIMADLGWATWKLQGGKNGDAEEFLRLALTFDDRHLLGLEYLAKVLVDKGDTETARVLCSDSRSSIPRLPGPRMRCETSVELHNDCPREGSVAR